MVVLINEGSASASEITAGAIQDLGRGKLVGYFLRQGLGANLDQPDGEGGVRITIARWLTPNGRQITSRASTRTTWNDRCRHRSRP